MLWGLLAVAICLWLLLPRVGTHLPEWKAGEVATFDVAVPRDMALPDEAATEALREEARAQVRPVYDLEPRMGVALAAEIHTLFANCRSADAETRTSETLLAGTDLRLEPDMLRVLDSARCSEALEAALADVARQIFAPHVVDDRTALERRGGGGVILRNLDDGRERVIGVDRLADAVDVRSELEPTIRARLLEHDTVHRRWLKAVTEFLAANVEPDLVFNRAETAERVQAAAAQVAPRSQVLKRGQILVRRGDTVTPAVARTLRMMSQERRDFARYPVVAGVLLLVGLVAFGWWQLMWRLSTPFERAHRLSLVLLLTAVFLLLERFGLALATAVALNSQGQAFSSPSAYLWALPHAAGPVVVFLLLGLQPAVIFAVFQALLVGIMLGGDFTAVVFALASGLAGALAAQRCKDRGVFARVGVVVGGANLVVFGILALYRGEPVSPASLALAGACALVGGPVAVGIAGFLLPALEGAFGITTDLRLLELSNQNLPILKRLSLEAPGTYQHSLSVGNLAEAGAEAVGANGLLLRVCSYYHDVGKLKKPDYFVENQRGRNPHDALSPSMSALVIMSHVKEGLELARKARLPLPIRQAIATHHGTKLMHFFFEKAKQRSAPETGEVRESDYRYPGPRPHTKELGILLLADAVEAAARTVDPPTPHKLQAMINRIVQDALADGQLDDTELTFKELDRVASGFMWVLTNMFHHRIDYPGFDFNRRQGKRDSGQHLLGTKAAGADG